MNYRKVAYWTAQTEHRGYELLKRIKSFNMRELMALLIPVRDRKMIVWNFMEELWSKYMYAMINGQEPRFRMVDFRYIDLFEKYLSIIGIEGSRIDNVILDALHQFEQRGLYKIEKDVVSLTEKGLNECRKSSHDWDR